jgi:hypothetical protein
MMRKPASEVSRATPRAMRRVTALGAALVAAALWAAAGPAPASAGVYDSDADPSLTFVVTGSGSGYHAANDVVIGNGVTYVVGYAEYPGAQDDATLTRISHTTWTATTRHYDSKYHRYDTARAAALGPDGSVYTAGSSTNAAGKTDILVVKWSKTGAVLWAKRYDGPLKGNDGATDIAVDRAGNVVVCGSSDGTYQVDWVVASWKSDGTRRWVWRYSGDGHGSDEAVELALDRDGVAYVTGSVIMSGATRAAALVKLGTGGGKKWMRLYTGPCSCGAAAYAVAVDPAGGAYIAGWADNGASSGIDAMVVRYSASGARTPFPLQNMGVDAGTDVFLDVCVTAMTKQVVAVGHRQAPGQTTNPFYARFTAAATLAERGQNPTAAYDRWTSAAADKYGGWVMTGSLGSDGTDVHTGRKSTLDGGTVWWSRYAAPVATESNTGLAVATRGAVTVAVGTQYSGAATGWDQVALIWLY